MTFTLEIIALTYQLQIQMTNLWKSPQQTITKWPIHIGYLVYFDYCHSAITVVHAIPWRNGSASDSRSEGCVFESRRDHKYFDQIDQVNDKQLFIMSRTCFSLKITLLQTLFVVRIHSVSFVEWCSAWNWSRLGTNLDNHMIEYTKICLAIHSFRLMVVIGSSQQNPNTMP